MLYISSLCRGVEIVSKKNASRGEIHPDILSNKHGGSKPRWYGHVERKSNADALIGMLVVAGTARVGNPMET